MKKTLETFLQLFAARASAKRVEWDEADLDELLDPDAGVSRTELAKLRAMRRENDRRYLAEHPGHPTVEQIVDNRVFLLGLDELYRRRMKRHESTELLTCARAVAARLNVSPAEVPIEGYYAETRRLTEYFRLMRGLQAVRNENVRHVARMREFQRLLSVVSAPLFGRPIEEGLLFPVGRDPLAQALYDIGTERLWTVDTLVEQAHRVAVGTDDFSLVGLASIARDEVVVAALRESVGLYAEKALSRFSRPPIPIYIWRVDDELARRAARFVTTFNDLFEEDLPEPLAENADLFFGTADEEGIVGRCVCIGRTPPPTQFYHWAIREGTGGRLEVEDFWDIEIQTTSRYRDRDSR